MTPALARARVTPNPAGAAAALPSITLMGARLHTPTQEQCVEFVRQELAAGRGGWIFTVNLDHLRRFVRETQPDRAHTRASLITIDGMPLVWASRLQGTPAPDRISGSDLILTLSAAAAGDGRTIFLLGGSEGAAEGTALVLRTCNPHLRMAGSYTGWVDLSATARDLEPITQQILAVRPDLVFVALGSPKSERITELLIDATRRELPGTWWIGVGISFSFVSGQIPRAPRWMQRSGLEWVHRLIHEPRRLAKRYLVQGLPFALSLFAHALRLRLSHGYQPK